MKSSILRLSLLVCACALGSYACPAEAAIGELYATDSTVDTHTGGAIAFVNGGMRLTDGASIVIGERRALLRLARGGEVFMCPRARLSMAAARDGGSLTFVMGTGAIEANYSLSAMTETITTPDFRVLLDGPGVFHFALGTDNLGNTCVRTLSGNTSPLVVSEWFGDGVYRVGANDQVVFHGGSISKADTSDVSGCGCPAVAPTVRAEVTDQAKQPPAAEQTKQPLAAVQAKQPVVADQPKQPLAAVQQRHDATSPLRNVVVHWDAPAIAHIEVPFVFKGEQQVAASSPPEAPVQSAKLPEPQVDSAKTKSARRQDLQDSPRPSPTPPMRVAPPSRLEQAIERLNSLWRGWFEYFSQSYQALVGGVLRSG